MNHEQSGKKSIRPYILIGTIYLILCALSALYALTSTSRVYVYPLDDTYITMAMSKNLVQHGVMGLTRHEFSFSSSCPLWTILIAGFYAITGVTWWGPLALDVVAGLVALFAAFRMLQSYGRGRLGAEIGLLAVCILTPMPAMALSGMEHPLHIALVLVCVAWACRFLGKDSELPVRELWPILPVVAAMVMVRYESIFLAGLLALLLLVRRKVVYAGLILLAALLPAGLLGLFAVSKGWAWLPNSVLLKGTLPQLSSLAGILNLLGMRSVQMLLFTPHLLGLAGLLAGMWLWQRRRGVSFWEPGQLMLWISLAAILLHLQFASVGWFFRYEAYLMALGVTALLCNRCDVAVRDWFEQAGRGVLVRKGAVAAALFLAMVPMAQRSAAALAGFPVASHNIYQQQYQMARFFKTYYEGASVAANDVGAINYMADLRCVDLVGLCNRAVYRLKRQQAYTSQAVDFLTSAERVQIAVVYDTWFNGAAGPKLPAAWIPVGQWHVADARFLGGDTVTFYAVDPDEKPRLTHALQEFASELPDTVAQRGAYLAVRARQ